MAMLLLLARLTRPVTVLGWVLLTPPCFLFAGVITPDAPLQCFWTAYVVWLTGLHERLHQEGGASWPRWLAGGVFLGSPPLSNYTMGLAGITAPLSIARIRPCRYSFFWILIHRSLS